MVTRRKKGSGSLRHLGNDRWQLTVKAGEKRISRVFTARNATEAHRKSAEVRTQIDAAILAAQTARSDQEAERDERREWTLERYIAYYFTEWAAHALAPTTRQRYTSLAKYQIVPNIGDKKMREVTPANLSRLYFELGKPAARYNKKGDHGLSNLTIWHAHTFLGAVYTFAVRNKDADENPTLETKPTVARVAQKKLSTLDVGGIERLIDAVRTEDPLLFPPVMVTAYLGTRRGETCGVRWSDVDFKKGEVTVRRSVTHTKPEGLIVKSTKTKKERTIPLDAETLAGFESLRRAQRRERLTLGPAWAGAESPEDDYVCAGLDGSVLDPDYLTSRYRAFANANGFAGITPHSLRHAFVSQLIALGFDAVTIASMSGHSPEVLLTVYAHAFDTRKREAMEALGEARRAARNAG